MILIPLTQERFALVDDEDADLLSFKWRSMLARKTFYAVRSGPGKSAILLHRVIAERCGHRGEVDHKNRAGLDCRRENLRTASAGQNNANQDRRNDNVSGYKGVSFHGQRRKWRADIRMGGKQVHLGVFEDKQDAARAYDAAAKEAFGEFAVLNFPEV